MQIAHLLQVVTFAVNVGARIQRRQVVQGGSNVNVASSGHGETNKYIVEFTQVSLRIAPYSQPLTSKGSALEGITHQLASRPDQNSTTYTAFDCSDIFHGISIETNVDNADSLRMMDGVANVWPMRTVPLAKPVKPRAKVEIKSRALNYSMHQWTGVNKLHEQGIRGLGTKVAIIDTGIDYTHQAVCETPI